MIRVVLVRKDGIINEVTVSGHSGYAKYNRDIVCAAVSGIVQTALMGVIEYSEQKPDYTINEDGYLHFSVSDQSSEVNAIINTMVLGLKDLEKGYASYLKVEEK